jgi:anti-anti-sigma factor
MTLPAAPPPAVPPPAVARVPAARTADPDDAEPDGLPLAIGVEGGADRSVVRVRGEVDILTTPLLAAVLHDRLAATPSTVLDLQEVSFVDCAGVTLLVDARRRARREGRRLHIVPGRVVARTAAILDLTGALGLRALP